MPVPERVSVRQFLAGTLETTRELLPEELRDFQERLHGSLAKAYYEDPDQHFEVWLRRQAHLVEVGLHFESRDREANSRMLEWFAEELGWIKAELGERTEVEPWDRGWTRVHQTLLLPDQLSPPLQDELARQLARMIELLEPLRREAASTPVLSAES